MSDATTDEILTDLARSDRKAYLEQRLFVLSPFNTFVTAALLFALAAGSYVLIALFEGQPILTNQASVPTLDSHARVALILSLLGATVLGIQRYSRERERAEIATAANIFRGGIATVARIAALTPPDARLGLASLVGLVPGALIVWFSYESSPETNFENHPGTFLWFATITILLAISFARGVELTRLGSQSGLALLQSELIIDLLRIDRLSFLGRSAARFSLIWFTVAAVSCLFFVSNGINGFTIGLLIMFAVIGATVFVAMMERIHRRIRSAKGSELERVRRQIDSVRDEAVLDGGAAQRLQGLLAYEARIMAAPEWPFDQTTLVRVGASALILTVPWFGQALAAYLIEHLGSR